MKRKPAKRKASTSAKAKRGQRLRGLANKVEKMGVVTPQGLAEALRKEASK